MSATRSDAAGKPPPGRPPYRVDVVSGCRALFALQSEWEALLARSGVEHPFLSPEWICTWWECFGAGKAMHVLVVRAGDDVVGMAPLMISDERMLGMRVRRLGSLYNPHTPRFEFVVARGHEAVYGVVWEYLREHCHEWDVLELCQLRADSETFDRFSRAATDDGFRTGFWRAESAPYLPINGAWDRYSSELHAGHRSYLRYSFRRLSRLGQPELEIVADCDEFLPPALQDGLQIEAAAWKGMAGTAIATQPELRRFYRRLAEGMARRGWLWLQFLTLDRRRIAFHYSLRYRNRSYLLKVGYDPMYARYSPGHLLCSLALRDAFERGQREYDFLGGDDAWKLKWTRQQRAHQWLYVFSDTPRAALLHSAKFRLAPLLRRGRDRLRDLFAASFVKLAHLLDPSWELLLDIAHHA